MTPHDTVRPAPGGAIAFGAAKRRLLAAMPLHAITSSCCEDGLRERLLIEAGRLPAADRDRVPAAVGWTGRLHAGDRGQREPSDMIARQLDKAGVRLGAITGDAAGLRACDGDGR